MQSQYIDHSMFEVPEAVLEPVLDRGIPEESETTTVVTHEPTWFRTRFMGCMEMYADAQTVAHYFDTHQEWFRRCAHPMKAEPVGANGYALTIGRFGSLGYQVEPKVGLELLPQFEGVYRIQTIPVPDYTPPGYEVDFQASQWLVEAPLEGIEGAEAIVTRVEWKLNLSVGIMFPKFIRALPQSTIQKTGDRVLAEIVKQVSRRLTYKVQEDFHTTLGTEALKLFKQRHTKHQDSLCQQCE